MAASLTHRTPAGPLRLALARRLSLTLCLALLASLAISGEASAGDIVDFSGPDSIPLPINPRSVAVGDFNSDGDPDLAVANDASSNVSILIGGLAGTFSGPTNIAVPGGAVQVAVGDFNSDQDADPDLAVVGSGGVSILLGGTGSTFSTGQTLGVGENPADVAVGDFNGDSDPDVAVANSGSDSVWIFQADVGARFLPSPTVVATGDEPSSIAIGNFDTGTDPDLAVTNSGQPFPATAPDNVSILTGSTGVSFTGPTNFTVGDFPVDVATADFNKDGDLDLTVANQGSGTTGPLTVSILTGGAGASFAASSTLSGGGRAVAVGDFNIDGDPDLAVGGNAGDDLSIFVGGAGASFGPAQRFPLGGAVLSLAVDDFDADGLPDVAGANYFAGTASTALNTSDTTPPDTTIDNGPSGLTSDNTPTFTFSSNEAGSTFECRVVGVTAFASCTSPHTTAALADGSRTLEVRATDAAGNLDTVAASRSFTVDATPPDTTIDSGPSGLTSDNTPTFTFSSEAGASFQCRVVGVTAFAACTSPHTTAALADGARVFEARAVDAAGNADPTPASRSLTVDTAAPDTTIDTGPSGSTGDNTPTFTFSSEAGASFQCRVGAAAAFAACTSPHTTAALADGARVFEVRAVDAAGNADPTPASRSLTVDTAAPDTTIDAGPSGLTSDNTPTFTFSSEAGASFQCRVGAAAAFAACTSPHTTAALADGARVFEVRAVDAAGNADPTPASRSLTVDTAAPDTTIDTGPSGSTGDNTPTFTFSSEAGASFQCRVDTGNFTGCTSPHTTATLADGARTFEVRAVDAAGNADPTPASRSLTVDTAAPETTIDTGPSGSTGDNTPTFTFSSNEAGTTFLCRVDPGGFIPCTSPHTTATLADGARTFEVRAVDAAGNVDSTPASRSLTVDAAPPNTTVTSGPSGPINDPTPTFAFSASETGSTFECRVDTGNFTACTSPHTTARLADGTHTFEVRAVDASGNADPTAVSRSLKVDTAAPETVISSGPSGSTDDHTPTFAFSSSEPGSTFQCKLDNSPFLPCSSPLTLPALSPGFHTFQVRSIDSAGNVDASPSSTLGANAALRSFTIAAAGPGPAVLGRRFNVEPKSGDVFVSVPPGTARTSIRVPGRASIRVPGIKGRNFVPLREARQVPVGSILDTRRGTVRLTSARNSRGLQQSGNFQGGVFQVLQSRKRSARGLTELRLKGSSFKACKARGKKASISARRNIRRVSGNARGRFRTRGRHSAATARGTVWTVTDRCDGTLTKVARGSVTVRDFRRRKNILVRRGKSYLARAPK